MVEASRSALLLLLHWFPINSTHYYCNADRLVHVRDVFLKQVHISHCSRFQKLWRAVDDVSDAAPRERALKSVSFQESVSVITDGPASMEVESQQIQHGCLSGPSNRAHNAAPPDGDGVQVRMKYLNILYRFTAGGV